MTLMQVIKQAIWINIEEKEVRIAGLN